MINRKIRFTSYIIVAITLFGTYMMKDSKNDYQLPKLGSIPSFEFTDSDGNLISQEELSGKVWVADFIFTTCTMACPVMTGNMNLIHKAFKNNDKVRIVSISVYPEYDTPEILKEYAERYQNELGADLSKWNFVTGKKDEIYSIARSYLCAAEESDQEDTGGFIHSTSFILIDKEGKIRSGFDGSGNPIGVYDGTSASSVKELIVDVGVLVSETKRKERDDER